MNFDLLAPHYDWMETLTAGGRLQQARTTWLDELDGQRRILSAGEGHGRFAEACATRFPNAAITCVESSKTMLARAQRRTRAIRGQFRWHCGDLLRWQPEEKFDAVVTCFFLDCFPPGILTEVVAKLAACAAEDALWIVVDFNIPPRGLRRWRARAVHALMYAFFRRVAALPARRLTPPDELLRAHSFVLVGRREFEWGLIRADLWRRG
ncbi:MAG: Methyltransferase type 12 [Lacunisphaera sp.]|nr:Methyltransferase type 12 [Lacunisphaera sp.]MDB6165571.1 Methyltransferase type 12 [Lacunisphaera sp.]